MCTTQTLAPVEHPPRYQCNQGQSKMTSSFFGVVKNCEVSSLSAIQRTRQMIWQLWCSTNKNRSAPLAGIGKIDHPLTDCKNITSEKNGVLQAAQRKIHQHQYTLQDVTVEWTCYQEKLMTLFMNDPYLCSTKAVADKSHTSEGKTKLTLGSSH